MGKGRLNQKGFMDLINATDRSEVIRQIYRQVYPTKIGFEALIPFEQTKERTIRITRKKPIKFLITTGDALGQKDKLIEEYSKAEYIEDYVSIEKAFVFGRKYSSLENLSPELIRADLDEIVMTEITYKRKAFLDMVQKEGMPLPVTVTNIKEEVLDIHDQLMDFLMEFGINIPNVWVFSSLDINRALRDKLKLNLGASQQIQQVLQGTDMILNGISSSLEGINYVGLPKKVSAIGPDGTPTTMKLLEDDVLMIAIEMSSEYRPFIAKDWVQTELRLEKNPVGNGEGAIDILEYVKGYDVLPVDALKMVVVRKITNPPTPKDIKDFLTEDKLKLGEVATPEEATSLAQMQVEEIPEIKGKVKLDPPQDNKIHVTANDSSLTGQADFTYTVKTGK